MNLDDLIPDKGAVLARHEFFRNVAPEVIRRLGAHARLIGFKRGERIFSKGDPGLGLLAVVSGLVKISVPSKDGKEIVLRHVTANEIFGEIALLDGGPRTADATATSRCQVLSLDRRDFVSVLEEEPALAVRLLGLVSRRLRQTSEQVEDISFADPQKRLAKALLRVAEVQGTAAGKLPSISLTQKELGRTIGLSRESTNKLLRDWENAGHISLHKGGCTIANRDFLTDLAAEIS